MVQKCYGRRTMVPWECNLEERVPVASPTAGPLQAALQIGRRLRSSLGIQVIVYTVVHHVLVQLRMGPDTCLDMVVGRLENMLSLALQLQLAGQVLPCGACRSQPFSAHELSVICSYR